MTNRKLRNFLALTGGLFFLLLAGVVILFIVLVNPNHWKNQIIAQVYRQTGNQLQIDGDVHWMLTPQLAIRINKVKLNNPFNFLRNSSTAVDQVDVVLNWKSLLSGSVKVEKLDMHHIVVHHLSFQASADASLNVISQDLTITQLALESGDLHLTGEASGRKVFQNPEFNAKLQLAEYNFPKPLSGKINHLTLDIHCSACIPGSAKIPNNISGILSADSLTINQFHFSRLTASLFADSDKIQLSDIRAKLAGGVLRADFLIQQTQSIAHYNLRAVLKNVELEELINSAVLQGPADIAVQLNTAGFSRAALLKNLNGTFSFTANNGFLNKKLLLQPLKEMGQLIRVSDQTPFSQLTATADIRGGLLTNHDLSFQSENLGATGDGAINLVNDALQYRLIIKTHARMMKKTFDVSVPVKIAGTLSQPIIEPESTDLLIKPEKNLAKELKKSLNSLVKIDTNEMQ